MFQQEFEVLHREDFVDFVKSQTSKPKEVGIQDINQEQPVTEEQVQPSSQLTDKNE